MYLTDARPDPDLCLPLQQHPLYADTLRLLGVRSGVFTLRDAGNRLGHVLWLERRFAGLDLRLASLGPVWAPDVPRMRRIAALRHLSAEKLRLVTSDEDPQTFAPAGFRRILTGQSFARLDLTGGPAARLARMHQKWRNRWTTADRGLTVGAVPFDPLRHHWLLEKEQARARAKRYRGLPPAFVMALHRHSPEALRLFIAHDGGARPEAAMLFICHGPVATYHLGWSSDAGRRAETHRRILVHAADFLAQRGCRRMDLGTLDTETAPGLARFKLGTGAQALRMTGTWAKLPWL